MGAEGSGAMRNMKTIAENADDFAGLRSQTRQYVAATWGPAK